MSSNNIQTPQAAAETPQPAPTTLTPEAIVQQLRGIRAQIGELTPLTTAQRRALQNTAGRTRNPALQASINVIDAADIISTAVGQPAAGVRQLHDEANRWTAVEDELRALLSGVSGTNLLRRQRVARIAAQAVGLGAQLSKDPVHAVLLPHVQEVRRLRKAGRRKKAAPEDPAPAPQQPVPAPPDNPHL